MFRKALSREEIRKEIDKHEAIIEFLQEQLRGEESVISCLELIKKPMKRRRLNNANMQEMP